MLYYRVAGRSDSTEAEIMTDTVLPAVLRRCILFQGIDSSALTGIAAAGQPRAVRAGAFFFFQDAPASRLYVLLTGRVKFTQVTATGQQVLVRLAGPGEVFGTVAALGDAVYAASAQAVGPCTALGWESAVMAGLLEQYPRLALNALRFLAGRLREFQDRSRELATERAEQRVAHALLRLADQLGRAVPDGLLLDLPLTRQDIAELTGTTLFTASRILRRWEQAGLISSGRAQVVLRQPDALRRLAETFAPD
jgi:CRP-like cAMP-binding protein